MTTSPAMIADVGPRGAGSVPAAPAAPAEPHEEQRSGAGIGNAKATRNLGTTIRPIAGTWRRRVRASYLALHSETTLNDERRLTLERCIFEVQNDLEHKRHDHPQVSVMNAIRNVLLDDVPAERGGNHMWKHLRWPHVEAMAMRIAGKRRRRSSQREAA